MAGNESSARSSASGDVLSQKSRGMTGGRKRQRQQNRDGGEKCIQMSSLPTTFRADTVAFGSMFTVQSYGSALSVFSMELNVVPVDPEGMRVVVYTKVGGFEGFQADPLAWELIADTDIIPAREGKGSVIAEEDFATVDMGIDEMRSFYVTLATSDLRYTRARQGVSVGDEFATDGYLSVHVGVGLGDFPFSSRVFDARLFNGIFHYRHATSCDEPMTRSQVQYVFVVGKSGIFPTSDWAETAGERLRTLLQSLLDGDLSQFTRDYLLALENIRTTFSLLPSSEDCPDEMWTDCARMVSTVTFMHRRSLASGHAQYIMLQRNEQITENLALGIFDAVYAGEKALAEDVVFTLEGVPSQSKMDADQQRYFEEVATRFTSQELLGLLPVSILGTKISSQDSIENLSRGLRESQRSLQSGTLDVSASVLAVFDPPAPDEFPLYVVSAVKQYRDDLRDDLINSRDIPGSIVEGYKGDFFANLGKIDARVDELAPSLPPTSAPTPPQPPTLTQTPKTLGIPTIWFILGCFAMILISIGWMWYYMKNEGICQFQLRRRGRVSVRPARSSNSNSKRKRWTAEKEKRSRKNQRSSRKRRRRRSVKKDAAHCDLSNERAQDGSEPDCNAFVASYGSSDLNPIDSNNASQDGTIEESGVPSRSRPVISKSDREKKRSSVRLTSKESSARESKRSVLPEKSKDSSVRESRQMDPFEKLKESSVHDSSRADLTQVKGSYIRTSRRTCRDPVTMKETSVRSSRRLDLAMTETPSVRGSRRSHGNTRSKDEPIRVETIASEPVGATNEPAVLASGKSNDVVETPKQASTRDGRRSNLPTERSAFGDRKTANPEMTEGLPVRDGTRAPKLERSKERSLRAGTRTFDGSTRDMRSLLERKTSKLDCSTRGMRGAIDLCSQDGKDNFDASKRDMKSLTGMASGQEHETLDASMRTALPRSGDSKRTMKGVKRRSARALRVSTHNVTMDNSMHALQGSSHVSRKDLACSKCAVGREETPKPSTQRMGVSTHSKRGDMMDASLQSDCDRLGVSLRNTRDYNAASPRAKSFPSEQLDPSSHQMHNDIGASVHSKKIDSTHRSRPDPPEIAIDDEGRSGRTSPMRAPDTRPDPPETPDGAKSPAKVDNAKPLTEKPLDSKDGGNRPSVARSKRSKARSPVRRTAKRTASPKR